MGCTRLRRGFCLKKIRMLPFPPSTAFGTAFWGGKYSGYLGNANQTFCKVRSLRFTQRFSGTQTQRTTGVPGLTQRFAYDWRGFEGLQRISMAELGTPQSVQHIAQLTKVRWGVPADTLDLPRS
jgi:hypothetical protein